MIKSPLARLKSKCGALRYVPGRRMNKRGSQHEGFTLSGCLSTGPLRCHRGLS
jgi:hypothetical protein